MAITYDDTTVAAIPGGILIDKSKFLNYYKVGLLWKVYYSFILNSNLEKLSTKYPKDKIVQQWISLNEHFQFGCVNPSIIINKTRGIYATYTDLTNDGGASTPVIKIVQIHNSAFKQLDVNDNDNTVSVALYSQKRENLDARAWSDFKPLLPELFSTDKLACQSTKEKISESAWQCLHLGLAQIENKELPGLHHLELSNDLTQKAY